MKFGTGQYFKKTPALLHLASDAFLAAVGVYTTFGVMPDKIVISAAVAFKILAHFFGENDTKVGK